MWRKLEKLEMRGRSAADREEGLGTGDVEMGDAEMEG